MRLVSFKECVFQKQMVFRTAQREMQRPVMGASQPLISYTDIRWDMEREYFKIKLSPLGLLISSLKPSSSAEEQDLDVLQRVLECFMDIPIIAYKQLYLHCGSEKPLVGGKLDLLVASEENGNKPVMRLSNVCGRDSLCKVYLGSLCEAKNTSVAQIPMVSSSTSYEEDTLYNTKRL